MVKTKWSADVMRVYQKYPAAFRSKDWEEIAQMANHQDMAGALELAAKHQDSHKSFRAENIIARRIRIQRVQLLKIQREHLDKIKAHFSAAGRALANRMIHLPNTISAIAPMRRATRAVIVELRKNLNVVITDLVWKSIILGVKNMGEAIKPILRDNQEAFAEELKDVALIEERLTMGVSRQLAGKGKAHPDLNSEKWQAILDRLYREIVKQNTTGMTLSERIWDLTNRAEQDIKRILGSDIAAGKSSRDIADRLNEYVFTKGIDEDYQSGPGIYRSPLKNALRVARTETNRAYTVATAAWAENKSWVKGIRVTLSPAHEQEDDCDDVVANQPDDGYSPDELSDIIPVHPHCMCFGTYVIDEKYLTDQGGAQTNEEEE